MGDDNAQAALFVLVVHNFPEALMQILAKDRTRGASIRRFERGASHDGFEFVCIPSAGVIVELDLRNTHPFLALFL